jgi:hypothetical protein
MIKTPRKYRKFLRHLITQNYADDRKFLGTESRHSPLSQNQANGHRYVAVKLANYPCTVDTKGEVARPSTHHVQKHTEECTRKLMFSVFGLLYPGVRNHLPIVQKAAIKIWLEYYSSICLDDPRGFSPQSFLSVFCKLLLTHSACMQSFMTTSL